MRPTTIPRGRSERTRTGIPILERLESRIVLSGPTLSLSLSSHWTPANAGAAIATGTVSVFGNISSVPTTVNLESSNPAAISVPASLVIPAGVSSATFSVNAPSGNTFPNSIPVTVSASAQIDVNLLSVSSGFTTTSLFTTVASGLGVNPDDTIVATGASSDNYLVFNRILPNGGIDSTFTPYVFMGDSFTGGSSAIQADGGIVYAGAEWNGLQLPSYPALVRFKSGGGKDTSLGGSGEVVLKDAAGDVGSFQAVTVQPDGKILAVGNTTTTWKSNTDDFFVVRFNADGSLDPTFGTSGVTKISFSAGLDLANGLVLLADGRIVVVGTADKGVAGSHFALARLTPTGQLDSSFGTGGRVVTDVTGDFEEAHGLALQPDGKLIVVGYVDKTGVNPPTANDVVLARYNADGSLDPSFSGGIVLKDFGGDDKALVAALQPDGMIEVGGSGQSYSNGLIAQFTSSGAFVQSVSTTTRSVTTLGFQSNGRLIFGTSDGRVAALQAYAKTVASDTITVAGSSVPRASNDSYTASKDTPLVVANPGLLTNDTDPNSLPLHAVLVAGPTHGTLTLNANGSFIYTPASKYLGPDSFSYKANNGSDDSNSATVSLNVSGSDDPPTAVADSYSFHRYGSDTSLNVAAPGVLANDSDSNQQPITSVLVSGPAYGSVTLNPDGSFVYKPLANFFGTDSFTYKASDGLLFSNVVTATIVVGGSALPTTLNYTTRENTPLSVAAPGLLTGLIQGPDQPLTVTLVGVSSGTATVNNDGSFRYIPATNFSGAAGLSYTIQDGPYTSQVLSVHIDVTAVNQPPLAVDDAYSVAENATLTAIHPYTSLTMTSEPGDQIGKGMSYAFTPPSTTFKISKSSLGAGAVEVSTLGPGAEFWQVVLGPPTPGPLVPGDYTSGIMSVLGDGLAPSNVTGHFTVYQAIYDSSGYPTSIAADFVQYNNGSPHPLSGRVVYNATADMAMPLTFNDSDPDASQTITSRVVTGPSHGSLALNADGTFTYVPAKHYVGTDTFTYVDNDGQLDGNIATVTITVTPVPDNPPVSANDSYSIANNVVLSTTSRTGVLANDTDSESDPLTARLITGPAHGTLSLNPDGSFSFTPSPGYVGLDSFTYLANDGQFDGNTATVSLTITTALNQPPIASNDTATVAMNVITRIPATTLLGNDGDPNNDSLSIILGPNAPAHGVLSKNPDGSLSYTPFNGFDGTDSFTYYASDGQLNSGLATVTVIVDALPVAIAQSYTLNAVPSAAISLLATDADGPAINYIVVSQPVHGTLAGVAPNLTYTPDAGYSGSDSFSFKANDGTFDSGIATVTLSITPLKVTPTISWATPPDIVYGAPLTVNQLNASASVAGSYSYSPPLGTILKAGPGQTLSVQFTPTDSLRYKTAAYSVSINVNQAKPTLSWAAPAAITYGTPLGPTQFDVSANVPGTLSYSPAPGTVLAAGVDTLTVTFTPTDATDYTTAVSSTTITVNKALLVVVADNKTRSLDAPLPPLTYTLHGFVNSDTSDVVGGSPALTTTATTSSPTGLYPITAAAGTLTAANYTFTFVNGSLVVQGAPFGDYDGVGHTELAVFRPADASWWVVDPLGAAKPHQVKNPGNAAGTFGQTGLRDIPVPGDYDGVGHTELAVFRPADASWWVVDPLGAAKPHQVKNPGNAAGTFGQTGLRDIPVPGDYDGVGHTELAVFRPADASWWVVDPLGTAKPHQVKNPGNAAGTFGQTGLRDIPVPGDYDGVGHTELAVFRPADASWWVVDPLGAAKPHQVKNPGNTAGTFGQRSLLDLPLGGQAATLLLLGRFSGPSASSATGIHLSRVNESYASRLALASSSPKGITPIAVELSIETTMIVADPTFHTNDAEIDSPSIAALDFTRKKTQHSLWLAAIDDLVREK